MLRHLAPLIAPLVLRDRPQPSPAVMAAQQARDLERLARTLAPLPVGRRFGLDRIAVGDGVAALRALPVTRYDDYADLFARVARGERDVLFPGAAAALAQTSGTTSDRAAGERFIPQSAALLDHHAAGAKRAFARLLAAIGGGVLRGQQLMLGGSTSLAPNEHGIPSGDLSGITVARIPSWLLPLYEPGRDIALESDWPRKIARITARCARRDVRMASGIPSWLIMLFDAIAKERGVARIADAWPHLRGMVHGGHAIGPFLPQLRAHLDAATRLIEVYPASEAFIAIGSRAWALSDEREPSLEVLTGIGVVTEYLPEDGGEAVGPEALVDGKVYRVLLTTPGGLLRYELGDLVIGCGPGRCRVAGRVKTRISVFGEHVEGVFLADALGAAATATGAQVAHYHVAPVLPVPGEPRGAHEWWVEFAAAPADADAFIAAVDAHLRRAVMDYDAHRVGGQLMPPRLRVVPPGTFHRFLEKKGKLGGQHKVPQAWPDRTIADQLALSAS